MKSAKDKLIVAVDVPSAKEARALIDTLSPQVDIFKIGSQIFTLCGPAIVDYCLDRGKKVFLDLKFHDIPNTVASAVASATALGRPGQGLFLCTVHTAGGQEMMEQAVQKAVKTAANIGVKRPLIIGITVLTSHPKTDNINSLVLERARLAKRSGLDGVVASSQEAAMLRGEFGKDFIIVTPGIRPKGAEGGDDQQRTMTPFDAISNGSNFLVVGRPVVQAANPLEAARAIIQEIEEALR